MGIFCAQCERRVCGGLKDFEKHLRSHKTPFICTEGDCGRRKFSERRSLYRHLRQYHEEACGSSSECSNSTDSSQTASEDNGDSNEDDDGEDEDEDGDGDNNENDHGNGNNDEGDANIFNEIRGEEIIGDCDDGTKNFEDLLERAAARLILDLRKKGNVTGTAISAVISEMQRFILSISDAIKQKVENNLKENNVEDNIIEECVRKVSVSEPFKSLKTKDQQIDYFEKVFGFIRRRQVYLGLRDDHKVDKNGVSVPIQVKTYFQYASITKILTAVLNNKVLFNLIHSEKKSTDGKLRSYLDGLVAEKHPIISEYPHTIRINFHVDDYDTPNPLGSKTQIHKISEVNFQIQNLPPLENARLRSVFVLAYAYKEDLPPDGVGVMMEPFFLEMEQLESPDGVEINVNGRPFTLRATLVTGSADDLAVHEALGLYAPSCGRFCSLCTVSRKDFHNDIFARGTMRTKEVHQQHVRELNVRSEEYMRLNYGVQMNTALWRKSQFAEFPEALIKDGMHDILKGIAPMEIKLALHEFCCVKKYFDVFHFNFKIQSFNYGPADLRNKPSPNFTVESVGNKGSYTIHQTAAQTWCLLQVFPFLVGDRVPLDNPHLRLLVLLKRISAITFSHVVAREGGENLPNLIEEHHSLFVHLYPPNAPEVAAVVEEEDNNEDDNNEEVLDDPGQFEDFLDPPAQIEVEHNDSMEEEEATPQPSQPSPQPSEPSPQSSPEQPTPGRRKKKKKKPKKILQINKHHSLLHYWETILKYGPIAHYWCMRFEGKHALPKRFAAIVGCFKNLPLTFMDLQLMYLCAELMDLQTEVSKEILYSKGSLVEVKNIPYFEVLSDFEVFGDDVLEELNQVTIAGFFYQHGLYVNLQLVDGDAPLFGLVCGIYVHEDERVFFITEDYKGSYDERFGAFLIEKVNDAPVRALLATSLVDRPMTAWTADSVTFYLSPRRTMSEHLFVTDA